MPSKNWATSLVNGTSFTNWSVQSGSDARSKPTATGVQDPQKVPFRCAMLRAFQREVPVREIRGFPRRCFRLRTIRISRSTSRRRPLPLWRTHFPSVLLQSARSAPKKSVKVAQTSETFCPGRGFHILGRVARKVSFGDPSHPLGS